MTDPSARNQSHVGRVCFPLRAEMHGRGHITDSCFIAFITSKMIADDFLKYVVKVMHYMKKALLYNSINLFRKLKI